MYKLVLISSVCLAAIPSSAVMAQTVSIYSDLCYHEEAGDALGYRFLVFRSYFNNYLIQEEAEGELSEPRLVPAHINGNSLEFSYMSGEDIGQFSGTITDDALTGVVRMTVSGNQRAEPYEFMLDLPRQENDGAPMLLCGEE